MLKTQSIVIFSQLEYYHGHIFMWVYFLTPEVSENTSQYQPVLSAAVPSLHIKYVANLMTWHAYVFAGSWLYVLQITGSYLIPSHSDLFQHVPRCNAQSYLQHVPITNNCLKLPLSGSNQNCPFLFADFSRRCLIQRNLEVVKRLVSLVWPKVVERPPVKAPDGSTPHPATLLS